MGLTLPLLRCWPRKHRVRHTAIGGEGLMLPGYLELALSRRRGCTSKTTRKSPRPITAKIFLTRKTVSPLLTQDAPDTFCSTDSNYWNSWRGVHFINRIGRLVIG